MHDYAKTTTNYAITPEKGVDYALRTRFAHYALRHNYARKKVQLRITPKLRQKKALLRITPDYNPPLFNAPIVMMVDTSAAQIELFGESVIINLCRINERTHIPCRGV